MSLGCTMDSDLLAEFPISVYGRYMSCTEPQAKPTEAYIPDTIDGWNREMERSAQTTTVAQVTKEHKVNPYSDQLRYCGGLDRMFKLQSEEVLLEKVEFYVYDSIEVGSTLLDADDQPFQDAATINLIKNSALSNTKIYAQAGFHNGMIGQWQPNWFNPRMEINGVPWLGTGGAGAGGINSTVDQSIGVPLPHCETFHYRFNQSITNISLYAKAAQYIGNNDNPPTGKLQRYPVLALVYFRMKKGN